MYIKGIKIKIDNEVQVININLKILISEQITQINKYNNFSENFSYYPRL